MYAFDGGSTAEEIVQQYPSVSLSNIYAIISYVLDNRGEVDKYVARRRDQARALQTEIETRWSPDGVRERLLARGTKASDE